MGKQEKIFAPSVEVPDQWFSSCKMEPNLGIHKYHQKKTTEMLRGKQWICNGDRLQMSDQEESQIVGGCTIPGCYYPHYFSHLEIVFKCPTKRSLKLWVDVRFRDVTIHITSVIMRSSSNVRPRGVSNCGWMYDSGMLLSTLLQSS